VKPQELFDLTGKVAIVSGGGSGIGRQMANALAEAGADVVLCARKVERCEEAAAEIEQLGVRTLALPCDVREPDEVQAVVYQAQAELGRIDILINNAGVMAPPRHETADGFELQFGTNHLGHFALTGLLFEKLKASPGARIVTVSSTAAKAGSINFDDLQSEKGYKRWSAYGQSKLANLIFALDLQTRIAEAGLDLKSIGAHPGYAKTNLTTAGNDLNANLFSRISKPFMKLGDLVMAQDDEHGALPTLFAATNPDLPGGSYIGPDGLGELRGHPTIVAPRKLALDVTVADRLWEESAKLTGVEYDFGSAGVTAA